MPEFKYSLYKTLKWMNRVFLRFFGGWAAYRQFSNAIANSHFILSISHSMNTPGISVNSAEFTKLKNSPGRTTVLIGGNNVGKSHLLKQLRLSFGPEAILIGCQRFYTPNNLPLTAQNENENAQRDDRQKREIYGSGSNTDILGTDPLMTISSLSDERRKKLFDIVGSLIQEKVMIETEDPKNSLSQKWISIGGNHLKMSSTGTRLLLVLVSYLLDEKNKVILIDEPEIGLSPKAQDKLRRLLSEGLDEEPLFSHVKKIFISTHSHIFLDKETFSNNYSVTKTDNVISISCIEHLDGLQSAQFELLGNSLESLFLPGIILIVEGKTDAEFLKSVLRIKFPECKPVIHALNTEAEFSKVNPLIKSLTSNSPYLKRTLLIFDKSAQGSDTSNIYSRSSGLPKDSIIEWTKNGIEHYYPASSMRKIYSCTDEQLGSMDIGKDYVSVNGIQHTKSELCSLVVSTLNDKTEFNDEFSTKFIDVVSGIIHTR